MKKGYIEINGKQYKEDKLSNIAKNCILLIRHAEQELAQAERSVIVHRLALNALGKELEQELTKDK